MTPTWLGGAREGREIAGSKQGQEAERGGRLEGCSESLLLPGARCGGVGGGGVGALLMLGEQGSGKPSSLRASVLGCGWGAACFPGRPGQSMSLQTVQLPTRLPGTRRPAPQLAPWRLWWPGWDWERGLWGPAWRRLNSLMPNSEAPLPGSCP